MAADGVASSPGSARGLLPADTPLTRLLNPENEIGRLFDVATAVSSSHHSPVDSSTETSPSEGAFGAEAATMLVPPEAVTLGEEQHQLGAIRHVRSSGHSATLNSSEAHSIASPPLRGVGEPVPSFAPPNQDDAASPGDPSGQAPPMKLGAPAAASHPIEPLYRLTEMSLQWQRTSAASLLRAHEAAILKPLFAAAPSLRWILEGPSLQQLHDARVHSIFTDHAKSSGVAANQSDWL